METKLLKKPKRGSHIVQTSYRSHKENTLLLTWNKAATNIMHARQTKYIVKHILIECTDLAHIRETFYSADDMKELLQNIELRNVMSFLKAVNTRCIR